jgi:transglutaminase/protease-like cytokinesis protein 3
MKAVFIACLVSINFCCFSNNFWKKDYPTIDSMARAVEPTTDLEKLVEKLTSHCKNDEEKYRSIFTWITHTIAYDVEALSDPKLRTTDAKEVIRKGKAVCAGYSSVFMELCRLANLECKSITGWAKKKQSIGKPLGKTDHEWNAIKIGDDWFLCDVTWGAGSTSESDGTFTFGFKDFYFCTPPEIFSYNHFPKDTRWLLDGKVSEKTFTSRPHFYSGAIKLDLKDLSIDDGILKYKKGRVVNVNFRIAEPVEKILVHPSTEKYSKNVSFTWKDGVTEFQFEMDKYAPYINIFVNGEGMLAYKVER